MSVLSWVFLPVILIFALALYLLALTVGGWVVVVAWREARFRVARRFRRVRVPRDGDPLNAWEARRWKAIVDGRKRQAHEPAYEERGES